MPPRTVTVINLELARPKSSCQASLPAKLKHVSWRAQKLVRLCKWTSVITVIILETRKDTLAETND